MSDENPKPPTPKEITVVVDGAVRELFISFGLQRELVAIVGSLEGLARAILDPEMMVALLSVALTKREKNGRPTEIKDGKPVFYDATYAEISDEDREGLLLWIYEHVTDFFMKRLQALESTMEKSGPELARLNSSATGLRDSILSQRAPGPSR